MSITFCLQLNTLTYRLTVVKEIILNKYCCIWPECRYSLGFAKDTCVVVVIFIVVIVVVNNKDSEMNLTWQLLENNVSSRFRRTLIKNVHYYNDSITVFTFFFRWKSQYFPGFKSKFTLGSNWVYISKSNNYLRKPLNVVSKILTAEQLTLRLFCPQIATIGWTI